MSGWIVRGWMGVAIVAAACAGDKDTTDTGDPDADADTDADTDTDTDVDTDTDTDVDTDADADTDVTGVRVVHVAPDVGAQDMIVNGNDAPPVLQDLRFGESTVYSPRPPAPYTFAFADAGAGSAAAWTSFDYELLDATRHTLVVYGTPKAREVLALTDDDTTIPAGRVRIRWTHAAPAVPGPVDLTDDTTGTVLASDLAYGDTVEADVDPITLTVALDQDGDGTPEARFAPFSRAAGDYFHVMVANDPDGTLFLLGQSRAGETPRRELLP